MPPSRQTELSGYLGFFDITAMQAFTDGAVGFIAAGANVITLESTTTVACLLEARGAYAPGNAEVFTITLEVVQNNQ